MNFTAPDDKGSLTHEQWVAREAERMKWRRETAARRRTAAHDGFWDEQTIEPEKRLRPANCKVVDCDRPVKARGLCERDYKRARRQAGKTN